MKKGIIAAVVCFIFLLMPWVPAIVFAAYVGGRPSAEAILVYTLFILFLTLLACFVGYCITKRLKWLIATSIVVALGTDVVMLWLTNNVLTILNFFQYFIR